MVKTIKQLADELGVSKQTIQYHYQRLPTKDQQKDSQGKNLISPLAESIVKNRISKSLLAKNQQNDSKEPTKTSKEDNGLIATLRREVRDLKLERDKQLATKDRQLDHLTKLIDQQQQLQLAIVTENRQLKEHMQKLSGFVETSRSNQKVQSTDSNLSTENNSIQNMDRNDKQVKKNVPQSDNIQKDAPRNKIHKNWWHFW